MSIVSKLFFNLFTTVKSIYVPPAWLTAFIARVVGDGGALEIEGHTVSEYNHVITYTPTLIQTCDTTKATAQNFAVGSEDISNPTYWAYQDVTATPDAEPNPFGGSGVSLVAETGSTLAKGFYQQPAYQANIVQGQAYTISAYVKKGDGLLAPDIIQVTYLSGGFGSDFYANYNISTGVVEKVNGGFADIQDVGGGWYRVSLAGVATSGGTLGTFVLAFVNNDPNATRLPTYTGNTSRNVYVWGVQFVQGNEPGDYIKTTTAAVDSTGTLYNVVPNTADFNVDRNSTKYILGIGKTIIPVSPDKPAIEFNPDTSYKGLLVEPAATNLCRQSENLSTTWIPTRATPTQSTEETPDGDTSNKYIKLVDNGSPGSTLNGSAFVSQTLTVVGDTQYTASVFLKKDGVDWVALQGWGTIGNPFQYFNLGAGTKGSGFNVDDSKIEAYPNGWYRCSMTWTPYGVGSKVIEFRILLAEGNNDSFVPLDGTSSIFVWGAQVELGPIATSYIPTTTASVTRNKDDITLGSASSLIGQTEGTIYMEVDWRATDTLQILLDISDGTANNLLSIYKYASSPNQLRMYTRANANNETDQGVDSSSFSGIQNFAFAYKTNDFELYRNGSSVSSSTSGSLAALATLTDIDIGQAYTAGAQANMWIRAVVLYPTRLIADNLEALTRGDGYFFGVNTDQFGTSDVTFSER